MVGQALLVGSAAAAGLAWAARGRSSTIFGPSVWRGLRTRRAIALTFDDGPTPGTARLLEVLAKHRVRATFFQCGLQVRRNPSIAREVLSATHEIGNHTETHPRVWLRSKSFIREEIRRAQQSITEVTGTTPKWFRAPYGVRWSGMATVQRELGLTGVMWTTIGRDWTLTGPKIAQRVLRGTEAGAIICLHDGRVLAESPDIGNTIEAVTSVLPVLIDAGWEFATVSELVGYIGAVCPKTSYGE